MNSAIEIVSVLEIEKLERIKALLLEIKDLSKEVFADNNARIDTSDFNGKVERITLKEAAKILNVSTHFLDYHVKEGNLNIGVFGKKEGALKGSFYIYKHLVEQELLLQQKDFKAWKERFLGLEGVD